MLFRGTGRSQLAGFTAAGWRHLEVAAADASGFGQGRCRYSVLIIACGPTGHPFPTRHNFLFVIWFKLTSILIAEKRIEFLPNPSQTRAHFLTKVQPNFEQELKHITGLISHVLSYLGCAFTEGAGQLADAVPNASSPPLVAQRPCPALFAAVFR